MAWPKGDIQKMQEKLDAQHAQSRAARERQTGRSHAEEVRQTRELERRVRNGGSIRKGGR